MVRNFMMKLCARRQGFRQQWISKEAGIHRNGVAAVVWHCLRADTIVWSFAWSGAGTPKQPGNWWTIWEDLEVENAAGNENNNNKRGESNNTGKHWFRQFSQCWVVERTKSRQLVNIALEIAVTLLSKEAVHGVEVCTKYEKVWMMRECMCFR